MAIETGVKEIVIKHTVGQPGCKKLVNWPCDRGDFAVRGDLVEKIVKDRSDVRPVINEVLENLAELDSKLIAQVRSYEAIVGNNDYAESVRKAAKEELDRLRPETKGVIGEPIAEPTA
jgi:hypothetical protein